MRSRTLDLQKLWAMAVTVISSVSLGYNMNSKTVYHYNNVSYITTLEQRMCGTNPRHSRVRKSTRTTPPSLLKPTNLFFVVVQDARLLSTSPQFVDWRTQRTKNCERVLSPVKDQGHCGSCWAFTSIATLESNLCLNDKQFRVAPELSVQQLLSCSEKQTQTSIFHFAKWSPNITFMFCGEKGLYYSTTSFPFGSTCARTEDIVNKIKKVKGQDHVGVPVQLQPHRTYSGDGTVIHMDMGMPTVFYNITALLQSRWIVVSSGGALFYTPELINYHVESEYGELGCTGGHVVEAYRWTRDQRSKLLFDKVLPYVDGLQNGIRGLSEGNTSPCPAWLNSSFMQKNDFVSQFHVDASIQEFGHITSSNTVALKDEDIQKIQNALWNIGPLSVAIDASALSTYESGVIQSSECGTDINHAVQLVGYDKCQKYWILRNSWGESWGEDGFFRLEMGDTVATANTCGVMEFVSFVTTVVE